MSRKETKTMKRERSAHYPLSLSKNLNEINYFLGTHKLKLNPQTVYNVTRPVILEDVTIELFFPKVKGLVSQGFLLDLWGKNKYHAIHTVQTHKEKNGKNSNTLSKMILIWS